MTTAQTTTRFTATLALSGLCAVVTACTTVYGAGLMNASLVGGSMTIDGPMTVHGSLTVGGPAMVHGVVGTQKLVVGGPVETIFPHGEHQGPAGQTVSGDLIIGGPLTVNGPLLVEGTLKIGGPLKTEISENNETYPVTE